MNEFKIFKNKKIIITGHTGFKGAWLTFWLYILGAKIIGVSILTSLDNKALKEIGYNKDVKKLVLHQAKLAQKAKLDAIVCSAQEVKIVRKFFKKEIITPGIRFNSKKGDQKRVLSPKAAFRNGSDWLVIGRPITKGNIKNN